MVRAQSDPIRPPKLAGMQDRRRKLTDEDKETIRRRHAKGDAIHAIARDYADKCSRRLVQFVLFPERDAMQKAIVKREKRWLKYYDKKTHTQAIKRVREHRRALKLKNY